MIGEALRLIRVYHDLRQNEAARLLGISQPHISEIEGGTKKPSLETIEKYSVVFKIPTSSIMFFSESLGGERSRASTFVAEKVLFMLRLIEEKASSS